MFNDEKVTLCNEGKVLVSTGKVFVNPLHFYNARSVIVEMVVFPNRRDICFVHLMTLFAAVPHWS